MKEGRLNDGDFSSVENRGIDPSYLLHAKQASPFESTLLHMCETARVIFASDVSYKRHWTS
jgi:hypothetical protein